MKKCIFPGSFDPFHKGHLYVLKKGLEIFDKVFIVVANNCRKKHKSSLERRKTKIENYLIKTNIKIEKIEILICNEKYMADFAKKLQISSYIRGTRTMKDFIYEKKLQKIYHKKNPNFNLTLFLTNKEHKSYSSTNQIKK